MNASLDTKFQRKLFGSSIDKLRAGSNWLQKTTQIFKVLFKYLKTGVLNKILKRDIN